MAASVAVTASVTASVTATATATKSEFFSNLEAIEAERLRGD